MVSINDLLNFAKYKVITSTRQSDGAKLIATRVILDERLRVRWGVEIIDPQQSPFKGLKLEVKTPLSTSH